MVVVDNASPDDSAAIAGAHGATVIEAGANRGVAHGANLGVAATTAAHILLINPDVRIRPGAVAAMVDCAARHGGALVGPRVTDAEGQLLPTRRSLPTLWSLFGEEVAIPERALAMARSTRRFVSAHLGRRANAARLLVAVGQQLRWLAWSLPGLRGRPGAAERRIQHAAYLRGLGTRW